MMSSGIPDGIAKIGADVASAKSTRRRSLISSVLVTFITILRLKVKHGAHRVKWLHSVSVCSTSLPLSALVLSSCAFGAVQADSSDEEDPTEVRIKFVVAWILLGSVAMVMFVFYLVNYPDHNVQKSSWVAISNTASLFSAILIFRSIDRMFHLLLSTIRGEADSKYDQHLEEIEPDLASIMIKIFEFIVLFFFVEGAILRFKKNQRKLSAWGLIGAHIVGFAAVDAFYALHVMECFTQGLANGCIVVVSALTVFLLLFTLGGSIRFTIANADRVVDEFEQLWMQQCGESEDECTAFAIGFLISVIVRQSLRGIIPALHWVPENTGDQVETMGLLGISVVIGSVVIMSSFIRQYVEDDDVNKRSFQERAGDLFTLTMAMSNGWCLLFWGHWQLWLLTNGKGVIGNGNLMVFSVVIVLMFTFMCFGALILIDMMADRLLFIEEGLRALEKTFILLLGLTWEAAFNQACAAVQQDGSNIVVSTLWQVSISFVLCAIVIPAWSMYILPKALMVDGDHCKAAGSRSSVNSSNGPHFATSTSSFGFQSASMPVRRVSSLQKLQALHDAWHNFDRRIARKKRRSERKRKERESAAQSIADQGHASHLRSAGQLTVQVDEKRLATDSANASASGDFTPDLSEARNEADHCGGNFRLPTTDSGLKDEIEARIQTKLQVRQTPKVFDENRRWQA